MRLNFRNEITPALRLLTILAFVTFFLVPGLVSAQEDASPAQKAMTKAEADLLSLKKQIETCTGITLERGRRLRCYDAIAVDLGFITTEDIQKTEEQIAKYGFWEVIERKVGTGNTSIYLRLDSSTIVKSAYGPAHAPTLILRCTDKNTDVFLDWGGMLGDPKGKAKGIYVDYKLDSAAFKAQEWEYSLDFSSAFVPRPVDFVRELKGKKELTIQITPFGQGGGMANLIFNLEQFENALAALVDRCYK